MFLSYAILYLFLSHDHTACVEHLKVVDFFLQSKYLHSKLIGLFRLCHVFLTRFGQLLVVSCQELVVLLKHYYLLIVVIVHLHAQMLRPVQGICVLSVHVDLLLQLSYLFLELLASLSLLFYLWFLGNFNRLFGQKKCFS